MKALLISVIVALVAVQLKPDFSGTWSLASSDSPAAVGGVKPTVVVLTQTDTTLTLRNGERTIVFPLDGSETTVKPQGSGGPPDLMIRSRWEGSQLVVEQLTANTSITTTVSMTRDGRELTVETVAKTLQGEGREKQVFKKSN